METLVKNAESEKDGNSLPKHLYSGEPLSEIEISELLDEAVVYAFKWFFHT